MLISTTDVSASRLMIRREPVGGSALPMSFTSCLMSSATVPFSPMRGVTVRMTPASRYSTDCVPTTDVVFCAVCVVVPPIGTCWLVTIGIESDTLMTAFLFSVVSTCGLESTLTRLSDASMFSSAKNSPLSNASPVSPAAGNASATFGGINVDGEVIVGVSGLIACCAARIGFFSAQSMPNRKSSVSVISATRTSISTWRGIRSSCRMVVSISAQLRGNVVTITAFVVSSAMKRT